MTRVQNILVIFIKFYFIIEEIGRSHESVDKHPLYASVLNTLALTYMDEGKKDEGIELLEKSLEIMNNQTDR